MYMKRWRFLQCLARQPHRKSCSYPTYIFLFPKQINENENSICSNLHKRKTCWIYIRIHNTGRIFPSFSPQILFVFFLSFFLLLTAFILIQTHPCILFKLPVKRSCTSGACVYVPQELFLVKKRNKTVDYLLKEK